MRIIAGKYRSLVLAGFSGQDIRPTADRVKESLFNIISAHIPAARVLDLFCGSGGLGLECISRGAAEVHFNDLSRASVGVLKKNLSKLKGENNYRITNCDYSDCLKSASAPYDLIFLDPPYKLEAGTEALKIISARRLLAAGGIAVLERDRAFLGTVEGLELYDERKYGITYLSFFKNTDREHNNG